jgi:hypothetical protein
MIMGDIEYTNFWSLFLRVRLKHKHMYGGNDKHERNDKIITYISKHGAT